MTAINPTFTSGADSYVANNAANSFTLNFLAGADHLDMRAGSVVASMGDDNDTVEARGGTGTIHGDAGNDLFNIRGGSIPSLYGDAGDDRFNFLSGGAAFDLHGGDGNDLFLGYKLSIGGNIYGDAGNDFFNGFRALGGNALTIYGGTGNDIYQYFGGSNLTFVENAGEGIDQVQVATGTTYFLPNNIENLTVHGFANGGETLPDLVGNDLNNHIAASNIAEVIYGYGGNDSLYAYGGDDTIYGGDGNDILDGGTGNDDLFGGNGNDVLQGRSGNDYMVGNAGNDTYYVDSLSDTVSEIAGEGTDTVRSSVSGYALTSNVENGIVSAVLPAGSYFYLYGNASDNVLTGNTGADALYGQAGNDTLKGGAGDDYLFGGTGDDSLIGGTGYDHLYGEGGDDKYYIDSTADTVIEYSGDGLDTVYSSVSGYTLTTNVENGVLVGATGGFLTGNSADNVLTGSTIADWLSGSDGNDTINAGDGNDILEGDNGDDTLNGGNGDDFFLGGAGRDVCTGGAGSDTYIFNSTTDSPNLYLQNDFINDFDVSQDKIDISGIDADTTVAGDQAFHFVSGGMGTGNPGEVWLETNASGDYFLVGDVDGDGTGDFAIGFHVTVGGSLNIVY